MIDDLVRQYAARMQDRRDRNLAIRFANATNGARNVDGTGGGSATSSTR